MTDTTKPIYDPEVVDRFCQATLEEFKRDVAAWDTSNPDALLIALEYLTDQARGIKLRQEAEQTN